MDTTPDSTLVQAAIEARREAYAPYSRFAVGAALYDDRGEVHCGCNVENASYGLTVCAERVAILAAVARGRRTFRGLVVATEGGHAPCGACRQVLAEFCADLPIWLVDVQHPEQPVRTTLADLLPRRFERP